MANFWLTPVTCENKLVLGAERILCAPLFDLHAFRERLSAINVRVLPMFKANLLPDDDDEFCGSDEGLPELDSGLELTFDGNPLRLSHCAEAFFDRLPGASECLAWMKQIDIENDSGLTQIEREWLRKMIGWLESGYQVILLRED